MAFELYDFARGFVAALVELGLSSIRPKDPEDLRSLHLVRDFVLARGERLRRGERDEGWFRDLVRLGNALSPGPTGSFDRFETALRDLGMSFTEPAVPRRDGIAFTVSAPFATSTLEAFGSRERGLAREAAGVFVRGHAGAAA